MNRLRIFLARLKGLFRGARLEESLDAELQSHLQFLIDENVRRGMSVEEARYTARREFGGLEQTKEAYREQRGLAFIDRLIQDLRYGARLLRKSPGFTFVAVLTLAVGIAVNTTVFTAFDAMALRPLPVKEPERLARVFRSTAGDSSGAFSYPDYVYYRDHSRVFSDLSMLAFGMDITSSDLPVTGQQTLPRIAGTLGFHVPQLLQGSAQPLGNGFVSGNYFPMLGTRPALGRMLLPDDDREGASPVVVLSGNFWRRQFHANPNIVGSKLHLNAVTFTIVGVTEMDYSGTADVVPDIWLPISTKLALGVPTRQLEDRGALAGWLEGRLKPGKSLGDARQELQVLASQLASAYPDAYRHAGATVVSGRNYVPPLDSQEWSVVAITMAAVALLLLIACANVAGLLLARSAVRRKEIAVRLALGAGPRRLLQQLLTESAIIGILAGAVGLPLAWWMLRLLILEISSSLPSYWGTIVLQIAPDIRIFCYTLFISLVTGLAFGLTPASQSMKVDLNVVLKDENSVFAGRLGGSRLRDLLIAGQIAACLVLLISSALLLRGSQRALSVDPGFEIKNVLYLQVFHPDESELNTLNLPLLTRAVEQRMSYIPGVTAVARASRAPMGGGQRWVGVSHVGNESHSPIGGTPEPPEIGYSYVSPNYFDTLGIHFVRGRTFTIGEADGRASVAIVSESTAHQLWPGQDPIGKHFQIGRLQQDSHFLGEHQPYSADCEVIGVVRNVRSMDLRKLDDGYLYLPLAGTSHWDGLFLLRTEGDPTPLLSAFGKVVRETHVNAPVVAGVLSTMVSFDPYFVISRIGGVLASIVGSLGVVLACLGVYGMVSYSVVQRTHEVGIRIALGAQPFEVQTLMLKDGLRPIVVGIGVGIAASVAVSRILAAMLFGLNPVDAYSFIGVSVLLATVALLSSWLPARRATQVDPLTALRYE